MYGQHQNQKAQSQTNLSQTRPQRPHQAEHDSADQQPQSQKALSQTNLSQRRPQQPWPEAESIKPNQPQPEASTDEQLANIKVASAALKGSFENHPLLLGLCLQPARMLERQGLGLSAGIQQATVGLPMNSAYLPLVAASS